MHVTTTHQFAARLLGSPPLTKAELASLRSLLLDLLAVSLFGSRLSVARAVQGWARRFDGTGRAVVGGTPLAVDAEVAGFANAVAGHGYELDDTHDKSLSHPGAVIIPTAIAVASETGSPGRDVLSAVAVGYEAMGRLGVAARAEEAIRRGMHPTSFFGTFGAAATAARLIPLDTGGLLRAWGHCLSLAGGSMQFSQQADGADVKRLHAGFAARNGILAARLAAAGIAAPADSIEGRYGMLSLVGAEPDLDALDPGSDGTPVFLDVSVKPYACNRLFHAAIDALRTATGFTLPREQVRALHIRGPRKLVEQHVVRRPNGSMAAQYSLPFAIGATMTFGPEAFEAYEEGALGNAEVLAWADMVSVGVDDEFERLFPAHFGAEVELSLISGEVRRARVLDSLGTTANPMPPSEIEKKARRLVTSATSPGVFETLLAAIEDLPEASTVDRLQAALRLQ